MISVRRIAPAIAIPVALLVAACGKKDEATEGAGNTASAVASAPAAATTAGGTQTPDAGGKVVTVTLTTDEKGNYFTPSEIEVKKGDVIRYTLKMGVHNVHFLADSNPGKTFLPPASDFLQLPGQTYDVKITWPEGKYYFQCDPHAALGMRGHVKVED